MHKLSTKSKKILIYQEKGFHPNIHPNFVPGNETQPVADARGDQVYGQQVYGLPGE